MSTHGVECNALEMNEELANTVITRFSEVNFSRVTNISGFLMGIVRRVQQDGSGSGTNELEELPRPMRQRMLDLVDSVSQQTVFVHE